MILTNLSKTIIEIKEAINNNDKAFIAESEKFEGNSLDKIQFNKNVASPLINSNQDYQKALEYLDRAKNHINKAKSYE